MTTQITVRIPDELVDFADGLVREGKASSRAVVVSRALERERRRLAAERDAAIYAMHGEDPDDLDRMSAWAAGQPADLD